MGLKPTPRQASILQERVRESIESGRLPEEEKEIMEDLNTQINNYLNK
jgi:hypothetical protein